MFSFEDSYTFDSFSVVTSFSSFGILSLILLNWKRQWLSRGGTDLRISYKMVSPNLSSAYFQTNSLEVVICVLMRDSKQSCLVLTVEVCACFLEFCDLL